MRINYKWSWTRRSRWAGVLFGVLLLMLLRAQWLPLVGGYLIVADPLQPTEALLPLAGGQERVVHGAELFKRGYARWFVVTDMPFNIPGVRASYGALVRQEAIWQGVPEERIVVAAETVTTTYEEAVAVRELAQKQGWDSLLVVTDPFHTRRSRLIFREVFHDSDILVAIRPVHGHWYQANTWWRSQAGLRVTWTEYLKFLLYLVGYR